MDHIEKIARAVEAGNARETASRVNEALQAGESPEAILSCGMIGAMQVIGDRFAAGDAFVPEMMMAARAMKAGVGVLQPYLAASGASEGFGKVVIGTVQGDLHDIGKNLVAMMIESAGFTVVDLGVDVPAGSFASASSDPDVRIVALSTLLTTTMPAMEDAVSMLNKAEHRARFRVLVGGAPVTQAYADAIGADAYAPDAASAAAKAKQLAAQV